MPLALGPLAAVVLVVAMAGATFVPVALADHDPRHGEICGGYFGHWVCGEIIVKPKPGADIREIVARHGGNASDILRETDLGGNVSWFVIAVPVGGEVLAVDSYLPDPDVEYAELNGVIVFDPPTTDPPSVPGLDPKILDFPWLWVGLAIAIAAVGTNILVAWRVWRRIRVPSRPPKDKS